jgi:hypothetical protein
MISGSTVLVPIPVLRILLFGQVCRHSATVRSVFTSAALCCMPFRIYAFPFTYRTMTSHGTFKILATFKIVSVWLPIAAAI